MGMKKGNAAMLSMMALAMSGDIYADGYNDLFREDEPRSKRKPLSIKKIIPKGMKEFFYGTKSIHALNQKNADKKARKQGLIILRVSISEA